MRYKYPALAFILMMVLAVSAYAQQYNSESDFEVTKLADG